MIIVKLLIWTKGRFVGQDDYGNRYYEERFLFRRPERAPKRWVSFAGDADPTKIPAHWHGWIHFTYEDPLSVKSHNWEKKHLQNLTGTSYAYRPRGSLLRADEEGVKPTYIPWNPASSAPNTKQ